MDTIPVMSDSSADSSDSYNGDDARHFLWEWKMAKDRYSEVTRENGQLETYLRVTEVALHVVEEETNTTWARLAEADAMVAGEFHYSGEDPCSCSRIYLLIIS
jgi:hypothetical protein